MIGKLSGRIDYRGVDHVLLDVRGVGYLVFCSERTLMALPPVGEFTALYTDLLVKEDLLQLYGFLTLSEKEWHRLLMSVQGIGAKASMAILGTLGPDGVSRAIATGDSAAFKAAKGVGAKTAQRVTNELKDKAHMVMAMSDAPLQPAPLPDLPVDTTTSEATVVEAAVNAPPAPSPNAPPIANTAQPDAMSALTNLGYPPADAAHAVATILGETPDADAPTLIRGALKLLAPKG